MSNYTMFRVWGIPIRVNISLLIFLPILVWLIGSGAQLAAYAQLITTVTPATVDAAALAEQDRWLVGIGAAVGLFGSVTFHELGHAWMAMRYNIDVESITLWILGGLASLSEMPKEWNREFWIAVAGPASSILLGGICYGALYALPDAPVLVVFLVGFLAVMNLLLAGFNMLPAFPMDGGRVLRALLARDRSYVSATRIAASVGTGFALLFAFVGIVVVFSPMLILLALFIYVSANGESRSVVLGALLEGLTVADLQSNHDPVRADATVETLLDRLFAARRTSLAVVDENGAVVGVVTAENLTDLPTAEYATTRVEDIATMDLTRLDSQRPAFEALPELAGGQEVAIVESDGVSVGIISRDDFTSAMNIRRDTAAF